MGGSQRNKGEVGTNALNEEPEKSVSLKLGKTHYDWLREFSKKRFGLANQAGMLRLILHEKYVEEETREEAAPAAEGNGQ